MSSTGPSVDWSSSHFGWDKKNNNKVLTFRSDVLVCQELDEYELPKDIILQGGLLLLATCIPLHYDDVDRQGRMITKVIDEIQ